MMGTSIVIAIIVLEPTLKILFSLHNLQMGKVTTTLVPGRPHRLG